MKTQEYALRMQSGGPDPEVGPTLLKNEDANNPLSHCLNPRTVSSKCTESCRVEAYWPKGLRYFDYSFLRHTLNINRQEMQERTYFDSGDFALSAAHRETDNGAIQTGKTHPHRESISHPYASIPASSNVDEDANHDMYRKSASIEKSPLLHQTDSKNEPTKKEGQGNHVSHEC